MAKRMGEAPAYSGRTSVAGSPRAAVWIVAGLTVLALVLRWACVHQSAFGDEVILYTIVHDRSFGQVLSVVHDSEKTPPLGFVLAWLLDRRDDATALLRLPSLVASVATVPLVYLLGVRTVGRGAGLVAAAWFALSPFQIFYGTEMRGYSLAAALTVLSTLSLLAALPDRRLRWWTLYTLAATAAVYTHYIAALVLVPQAAWALWTHRARAREQLVAHGLVVIAFLPWLPSFLVQAGHSTEEARRISATSPVTLSNVAETIVASLVGRPNSAPGALPGRISLAVLAVLGLGLLLAAGYRSYARSKRLTPVLEMRSALLVLLAFGPVAVIVLYSSRPHASFLLSRNLSVAVPYALLLFGALLTSVRLRFAVALSVAALAAVAVGTVKMLTPDYQRPDSRAAARYIAAKAPPKAVLADVGGPQSVRLYLDGRRRISMFPSVLPPAWLRAARDRSPVFISSLQTPLLLVVPPARYAPNYRLVASRSWPGAPYPITVREFAPG